MTAPAHTTRRRSWLFVPGADEFAHERAARSGADVLIQELEDFTPPPAEIARARRIVAAFEKARAAGRERARVDESPPSASFREKRGTCCRQFADFVQKQVPRFASE